MILVDTGAWLALVDRGDAYHARCREFFRHNSEPLMTTYPVLVAEEFGEGRIVSTDQRDFHTYRWKNQHPFSNLLLALS